MSNFLIIIFCLGIGFLLRRTKVVPKDGYKAINSWVIYVGLPATSFKYLPHLSWDPTLLFALAAPIAVLAGSILFIQLLAHLLSLSKRTAHTLMLLSGLSNTSFVGFPLVAHYFGEDKISLAIISDQMTFFLLSSVGIVIALKGSLQKQKAIPYAYIVKRICSFPPLVGCILALIIPNFVNLDPLSPFFSQLSATVSPLALFSIGMQLSFSHFHQEWRTIAWSLSYKLCIAPLLILGIALAMGWRGDVIQIATFEMAMPSLVATSMVLQEFKLNVKIGNSIIGASIVAGLLTTFFWNSIISYLL